MWGQVVAAPEVEPPCVSCALPRVVVRCGDGTTVGASCNRAADGACVALVADCRDGTPVVVPPPERPEPSPEGECGAPGHPACPPSAYCKLERACGGIGRCVPRPAGCDTLFQPVCGCDGKTHSSACDASMVYVDVAYPTPCPRPEGARCIVSSGDPFDARCAAGTFCKASSIGACAPPGEGVCTRVPSSCPKRVELTCGCDGKTYASPCEADRAAVNATSAGECP